MMVACAHTPAGDQGNPTGTVAQQLGIVSKVIANAPFQVQLPQGINYKAGQFTVVALASDEMQRQLVLALRIERCCVRTTRLRTVAALAMM